MGLKAKIGMGVAVLAVASIAMRRRSKAKRAALEKKKEQERQERRCPFRFNNKNNNHQSASSGLSSGWTLGDTHHVSATFTMTALLSEAQAAVAEKAKAAEAAGGGGQDDTTADKCPVAETKSSSTTEDPTSYILVHDFVAMRTMMQVCSTGSDSRTEKKEFIQNYLATVCPFFSHGGEPKVEEIVDSSSSSFNFVLTSAEHVVLMSLDREKSLSVSLVVEVNAGVSPGEAKTLALALGEKVVLTTAAWQPTTGLGNAQPIVTATADTKKEEDEEGADDQQSAAVAAAAPPCDSSSSGGGRYIYENDSMGVRFLVNAHTQQDGETSGGAGSGGGAPLVVEGRLTAEPQLLFYPHGHPEQSGGEASEAKCPAVHKQPGPNSAETDAAFDAFDPFASKSKKKHKKKKQGEEEDFEPLPTADLKRQLLSQVVYTFRLLEFPEGWAEANKGNQYLKGADKAPVCDTDDKYNKDMLQHHAAMIFTPWEEEHIPVELTSISGGIRGVTFEQTAVGTRMRCWIVPYCGKLLWICWECPEDLWAGELANVRKFLDGLHFFVPKE